jgi:hypothetical protein
VEPSPNKVLSPDIKKKKSHTQSNQHRGGLLKGQKGKQVSGSYQNSVADYNSSSYVGSKLPRGVKNVMSSGDN